MISHVQVIYDNVIAGERATGEHSAGKDGVVSMPPLNAVEFRVLTELHAFLGGSLGLLT